MKRRAEEFPNIFHEQDASHGVIRHHWGGDVIMMMQHGDEGGGAPMAMQFAGFF